MRTAHTAISLILCILGSFAVTAQADTVECGTWTLSFVKDPAGGDSDIIVTGATGSGHLDLTLVKQYNITGAIPSAFAYNNGLESINLPPTFTSLARQLADKRKITGTGEPHTSGNASDTDGTGTIALPFNLNAQASKITLHVTTDGSGDNEYGSCLLASGTEPFLDGSYSGGFQLFLQHAADGTQTITIKDGTSDSGKRLTHPAGDEFDMEVYYNPHYNFLLIAARYADGTVDTQTSRPTDFSVSELCYSLPEGTDETVSISDACLPFAGCRSLMSITADSANTTYRSGENGVLLNAEGSETAAYPYGRLFGKVVRINSVASPELCLSVNLYKNGDGYDDRSAVFESPDAYFGTTLFKIEANDNGTCMFRHLNSGFLMGKKSDSGTAPLDAVADPQYAGSYDYSLLPGSPVVPEFTFTDPYVGPVDSFEGVWLITDDNGNAMLEQNVSIAEPRNLFTVSDVTEVDVPVNSSGYATMCLPTDFIVPDSSDACYIISEFDETQGTLTILRLPAGMKVPAGTGILLKGAGTAPVRLQILSENTNPPMFPTLLQGTNLRVPQASGISFMLDGDSFAAQNGAEIKENSAYIPSSALPASAVSADRLTLKEGILTSVGAITVDEKSVPAYTLSGLPADPSQDRGIIITSKGKFIR